MTYMIVDVHSHFWEYPKHFSDDFKAQATRARGDVEVDLTVRWQDMPQPRPVVTRPLSSAEKRSYPVCGFPTGKWPLMWPHTLTS